MSTLTIPVSASLLPARQAWARPGAVRLTRRGRAVLFVVAVVAALALLVSLGPMSTATSQDVPSRTTQVVTIHSGDTLWSLASGLTGGSDTEAMVRQLMSMNNLDSGLLRPGQKLRVPRL